MVDIDKCQITHYPAEVLGERAKPVEKIDGNIRRLVEKMTDIMVANKGIGLAGPQAGVALRIFIISLDGTGENVRVYINPTVTPAGELVVTEEGCLSVPGIYDTVTRAEQVTVRALGLDGQPFELAAEGLLAVCIQHELDHLQGRVFVDYLSRMKQGRIRKKLLKHDRETM